MAGIHQYSSSLFIQSGSAAEFKTGVTASEITVEGTVFATEYKKLDGSSITGTGNIEFFAGSGSGVSRSLVEGGPFSQDHFFIIEGDNKVTENGYVCENGKGWDIVEACENYRENLLKYFDDELKPSSSFTNFYEIEQILDRQEGIRRNNLGAIVNSPLEEIEQQLAELVNKINNLKNV